MGRRFCQPKRRFELGAVEYGLDGHDVFSLVQASGRDDPGGHGAWHLSAERANWQRAGDRCGGHGPTASRWRELQWTTSSSPDGRQREPHRGRMKRRARAAATLKNFDGSVYGFALTDETLFAATSQGVLRSASSGETWSAVTAIPTGRMALCGGGQGVRGGGESEVRWRCRSTAATTGSRWRCRRK